MKGNYAEIALNLLLGWVGKGEIGGNNKGWFVSWLTHGKNGSWCAALIYTAIELSYMVKGEQCPIKRTHGARKLGKRIASHGSYVDKLELQPGDVVVLDRPGRSWWAHIIMVYKVLAPGVYICVDGNVGAEAKVRTFRINLKNLDNVEFCARLEQ